MLKGDELVNEVIKYIKSKYEYRPSKPEFNTNIEYLEYYLAFQYSTSMFNAQRNTDRIVGYETYITKMEFYNAAVVRALSNRIYKTIFKSDTMSITHFNGVVLNNIIFNTLARFTNKNCFC